MTEETPDLLEYLVVVDQRGAALRGSTTRSNAGGGEQTTATQSKEPAAKTAGSSVEIRR